MLSTYHDQRVEKDIDRRVKVSKEGCEESESFLLSCHLWVQPAHGVDLSDQIKVSTQFDRRCNFPFYVRRTDTLVFSDIGFVN